jgi:hypothetical protein
MTRFLDVTGRAIGFKNAVAGYHRLRMQSLDLIPYGEPLAPCLFIAFQKIGVRVVIDSIP